MAAAAIVGGPLVEGALGGSVGRLALLGVLACAGGATVFDCDLPLGSLAEMVVA